MRATYSIEDIFGSRSRVRVLSVLSGVSVPLNAARIAKLTKLSKPAVAAALGQLRTMGLVDSHPVGSATAHWLVRDNVYVQEMVKTVFGAEEAIPDMLLEDLGSRFSEDAISIVLFGSYARGDQVPESDVDVVLVGASEAAKARLDETYVEHLSAFHYRFGASLSVVTYDAEEARTLPERSPAFLASLEKDGIVVSGLAPWEWSRIDRRP